VKRQNVLVGLLVALLCAGVSIARSEQPRSGKIAMLESEGRIDVTIDGKLFTTYDYRTHKKPILFPVLGPGGVPMTRSWPVVDGVEGEAKDHPHHKGIWFSHDDVNRRHFWHEIGDIRNQSVKTEQDKNGRPVVVSQNVWVGGDGKPVCSDTTRLTFLTVPGGRAIDIATTIRATHGSVRLGDTKEGTMAIRTHPDLRLEKHPSMGNVDRLGKATNSAGVTGKEIWGKRAKWVDYSGEIEGKKVGIAIFDHPQNLRHPTTWHARAYGLVAANPFGAHDFSGAARGTGDYVIPEGGELTLRYRFVFHEGDANESDVAGLFRQYAGETNK
jgi:hypothetical protein